MALHRLRKAKIIHADIKPDNFLLRNNQGKCTVDEIKGVKLVDFGTAYEVHEHPHEAEYMVARYYRAPEIILGLKMHYEYYYGIDTWAVGCTLYQLYTG